MSYLLRVAITAFVSVLALLIVAYFLVRDHEDRAASSEVLPGDRQLFETYRRFLNDQIGLFSFTFALAALGTDSPQFYAFLSLAFVLLVWYTGARKFKTIVKIWNERKHPFLSNLSVFANFPVFLVGYFTLFLVAFGILEKPTMKLAMEWFKF